MRQGKVVRWMAVLLAALAGAVAGPVAATAQEPDILLLDGEAVRLNTNPLERYLGDKPPAVPEDTVISSANWRRYVATWEVVSGELRLKSVDVEVWLPKQPGKPQWESGTKTVDIRDTIFPGAGAVIASWYTGALVVPQGKMVNYVHMGYGSTWERYRILRVRQGRVVEDLSFDAEGFEAYRKRKFEEYTRTPEFRKEFARLKASPPQMEDEQLMRFMAEFHSEEYLSR